MLNFPHVVPPTVMLKKEFKPNLSDSQVTEITARLFGLTVSTIRLLPSYNDQNFHVACVDAGEFVLKVMNSFDSKDMKLLELQTHSMNFLKQNGLPSQTTLHTVTGETMGLEEIGMTYTHTPSDLSILSSLNHHTLLFFTFLIWSQLPVPVPKVSVLIGLEMSIPLTSDKPCKPCSAQSASIGGRGFLLH